MNTKRQIDNFLTQQSFAIVGVSRSGKKFGNAVYRMFKERGCRVYPINPYGDHVEGDRCFSHLKDLPEKVGGVVLVVPPRESEQVVKEAAEAGIRHVWMQRGSESRRAVDYCEQYGLNAVSGLCILMFAEPVTSLNKLHKWTLKILHRLPR